MVASDMCRLLSPFPLDIVPTNISEVRSFIGVAQYLCKFIASFLVIASKWQEFEIGKGLAEGLWGVEDQSSTSYSITKHVVALLSGDKCKWVCYVSCLDARRKIYITINVKYFMGRYQLLYTYDKELYTLVKYMKKWKQYLMGKEIVIYTYH